MKNIIDTSDVNRCSRCKKSLENLNQIYQTADYLFCSKDCLADYLIENEYSSLFDALLDNGISENVHTLSEVVGCTNCRKDMTDISPVYSDQYSNLFDSKSCIADFYVEEKYKCLRDALIDIGAADN